MLFYLIVFTLKWWCIDGVVLFGSYYTTLSVVQTLVTYNSVTGFCTFHNLSPRSLFTFTMQFFISLEYSFMLYYNALIHLLKLYIWISGQRVTNLFDKKRIFSFMSMSSTTIAK